MKKITRNIKGLSFSWDPLFFRNLTLILATIFIWRGVWNFADTYLFPNNFFLSNISVIVIGVILLFVFDTEVEEEEMKGKHKHLSNDLI